MSATGRGVERVQLDFYKTPAWCTRAFLAQLPRDFEPTHILDVGTGDGAITRELRAWFPRAFIDGVELDPGRAQEARRAGANVLLGDYLKTAPPMFGVYDVVASNPPFRSLLPFLKKMRTEVRPGGIVAVLTRVGWMQAGSEEEPERGEYIRANPPHEWKLDRRPSFGLNKDGKPVTDGSEYVWLSWGLGAPGGWTLVRCERGPESEIVGRPRPRGA